MIGGMAPANDNRDEIGEVLSGLLKGDAGYNLAAYRQKIERRTQANERDAQRSESYGDELLRRARLKCMELRNSVPTPEQDRGMERDRSRT